VRRFILVALAVLALASPARAHVERFSIDAHDVELADVIRLLGAQSGNNIIADGSVKAQRITLRLNAVTFDEALSTIASAYGLQVHREGRITIVGDAAVMNRRYPDDAATSGTRTETMALRHARPDDIAPSLQSALAPGTLVLADKRTGALVITGNTTTIARARRLVEALDAPGYGAGGSVSLETIPLRNVRAADAARALKGLVPDTAIVPDDRQNAIVVNGNAEVLSAVRSLLTSIDAPSRQVMIEVRVADVQPVNDSTDAGVQLGGTGFGAGALAHFPYTITKSSVIVNAQINTLIQHGRASILAQPRIATLNNREASLLIGEQYPVVTVNQQTGFPSVQTIDVGVRLRLTPTIGDDGTIIAELHPEYSQIIGFNDSFPIIANRKIDATLRVHDGETIVLGGLFQDVDSETITKFPILGDLPVLGAFFRNRQTTHSKDEVVFFLTPHILSGDTQKG
jgi:type IV pilus assembly protein PilQ